MVAITLTTVTVLTAVASHTHCHFNPSLKKQDKHILSPVRNLTWKELLAYRTTVHLTIMLQAARSKKTKQIYFLGWTLPPVQVRRLHISNHLVLSVYNPISPQNTSLIQTVTHACCHIAMKVREHPHPLTDPNTLPRVLPSYLYCHAPSYTFQSPTI